MTRQSFEYREREEAPLRHTRGLSARNGQVALPARNTDVRAAEVQLLTAWPDVHGAEEMDADEHGHGGDNH